MTNEDPELETSPLSGMHVQDGVAVEVNIFRIAQRDERWTLEVVDQDNSSTVWSDTFATDQDAYRAFYKTLQEEGIRTFLPKPDA